MFGVQLSADVWTRCSSYPQGKSETRFMKNPYIFFIETWLLDIGFTFSVIIPTTLVCVLLALSSPLVFAILDSFFFILVGDTN